MKKYLLILFGIFLLAYMVRIWYLPQNAVSFAYDQARDAFVVREMLGGDLKILGPSVSGVPGFYHGVLYYYLIAPFYFLGNGNPVTVSYFLSFFNALGVFVAFILTYLLSKKPLPSLVSAFIFAVSFESSQYANFLVNASLAVLFVPLIYIGLYLWISKASRWGSVLTGLGLGLSIQSEIALGYHFIPIIFWLLVFRKNIKAHDLVKFVVATALAVSTMIAVELKFGFQGVKGITYLLSGQDRIVQSKELGDFIVIYLNQIGRTFALNLFPANIVFGGLLVIGGVVYSLIKLAPNEMKKFLSWQTYLVSIFAAHLPALPFGGTNMRHITVGEGVAVAAFAGIFLWKYLKSRYLIAGVLLIIAAVNLFVISRENPKGQTIFPYQEDLVLSKEMEVLDYTYLKAQGREFSINTITSPLFVNTLWSYLYNWYGEATYGYKPSFRGRDQIGQLGNNLLTPSGEVVTHFLIIEPSFGIPQQYITWGVGEEDSRSKLIGEKAFGEIIIEERRMNE